MKTAEIRQRFLEYFASREHQIVSSSPLVPGNDNTLLFTNAGMVQFKDLFLGNEKRDYVRATTSQRCVRAGGKHNDLENVGYTARHHTFFEMLGNFSFGDYFKRDAINFAWEFLTKELGLPKEKLWVTVFEEDDEAADIWLKEIGVSNQQFSRIGAKDNFWSMGDVGPCGPCSEIFYDHGPEVEGGPPGTPEEDGDRYIEIWNLVFMQYDRSSDGTLTALPKPSVDTGMGLERVAAVMQHVHNNYEIDLFDNLIKQICQVLGCSDETHHSVRVIADHIRSCAFLITDGVLPSNEGRGYVLRRITRRAIRHGYQLGGETPFFYKLVKPLADEMGEAYPELIEKQAIIEAALKKEELRFAETLDQGLKIFEAKTQDLKTDTVPGDLVFLLYDTYGFPVDLTADVAREQGLAIDEDGFNSLMEAQRQRAKSSSQFDKKDDLKFNLEQETNFIGYNHLKGEAKVLAIKLAGNDAIKSVAGETCQVVLDSTPFYAEGGGQVGDSGVISSANLEASISDCQKTPAGLFVHFVDITSGEVKVGDTVSIHVDSEARYATASNHSATHLMHAALKQVLGPHVQQKGSLVDPEKLRFDFSHDGPVTPDEIAQVEALVNGEIFSKHAVKDEVMAIDQAKAAGAEALFGEKYGDQVRVVAMSDFSLELCGGTHVANTSEIGLFKITSESGVAAGTRRIEAVTRAGALAYLESKYDLLKTAATELKTDESGVLKKVAQLQTTIQKLEGEKKQLQQIVASGDSGQSIGDPIEVGGISLLTALVTAMDKDMLRDTLDRFKNKHDNGIIVLATELDGKAKVLAGVSKNIAKQYPAGKLVQHITSLADGRGGGRPDMAEGGIPDASQLEKVLEGAKSWVEQQS